MTARTAMFWVGGGLLCVACGGAPADSTGSSADSVNGSLSARATADAGHGKSKSGAHEASCKPLDGGRSPCARGDGGDDGIDAVDDDGGDMDQGDDDGGDTDEGDDDGGHHRDDGKRS